MFGRSAADSPRWWRASNPLCRKFARARHEYRHAGSACSNHRFEIAPRARNFRIARYMIYIIGERARNNATVSHVRHSSLQIQLFRVLRPTLVSLAIRRALALSPPSPPPPRLVLYRFHFGRGSLRIVVCRAVGARNDNRDPYVRCVFSAMDACRGNAGALLLSRNLKIPPSSPPFPVFFPSPSFPAPVLPRM